MTKKLDREFGRFDVDFTDSVEYLNMRPGMRAHAYLYLLALTGWSRKHRTDGLVAKKVARELGQRMGRDHLKLLRSLEEVSMISMRNDDVFVTKYSKWQETREEIEAHQKANRDRQARHRNASVTRESRVSHVTEREREKEREISNALKSDPATELGIAMHELLGRQLSGVDLIECQGALNQYAYLTGKELATRAYEHVDYCRDHDLPHPRSVGGFQDTWRRENDYRADKGLPKADRVTAGRVAGMTKAFEVAS